MQYAPSVEPPPPVDSGVTPSPTADPEVIRFADLLGQVLSDIPSWSDALNGAPLDYLFRPVLEKSAQIAELHICENASFRTGHTA